MDDATLRSLLDALRATPDNAALRITVIRLLHAAGDARAITYVDGLNSAAIGTSDRAFVARLLITAGEPARGLRMLDGTEPELLVERARALHALHDQAGALAAYEGA